MTDRDGQFVVRLIPKADLTADVDCCNAKCKKPYAAWTALNLHGHPLNSMAA